MRDFSLHLLDIIQNSVSAEASRIEVKITVDRELDKLQLIVADDGAGMDKELLNRITDPFVTTRDTRKIGLGIPLLKASVERASGGISIISAKGKGTTLEASCKVSHIDRLPLGDIAETLIAVISANPAVGIRLTLKSDDQCFVFDIYEIKQKLGDVPVNHYEVLTWIREFINEGIKITFGGVLDEIDN